MDVFRLVVSQVMSVVIIGLTIGVLCAVALSRVLSSTLPTLLFGVHATDPITFICTAVIVIGAALAAWMVPDAKAVKVEPTTALRCE